MKKTLLLLLTLLVLGGSNVWATKLYADLSRYGDKYNAGNGLLTMTWNAPWGNQIRPDGNPILPTGDLSAYTLYVNTTEITGAPNYRILVYTGNGQGTITVSETGLTSYKLSEVANCDITNVTEIVLSGSSSGKYDDVDEAVARISDLYIEKPFSLNFDDTGKAVIDITDMKASGGFSFNDRTGVLTTDGTSGELKVTFTSPVDLSALQRFEVSQSGDGDIITWTNFKKNESEGTGNNPDKVHDGNAWYSSKFGLSFDATQAGRAKDVTEIILHSNGFSKNEGETDDEYAARMASLSLTISKITITSNVITATFGGEKRVETLERNYYENSEWKTGTVTYSYGSNIGTPVGDGNATQDEYIELSDYNELRLYVSSGEVRIFMVKEDGFTSAVDGYILTKDGVKQNGQWGGVQDTEHKLVKNGDYYFITIADIKAACGGQAKLIGVKAEYGQTVDISKVVVIGNSNFDYNISGSGVKTSSATAALADASATSYDATGVTATGTELTPANPNALFIANEGALSNANNVIVDGTCANLVLTDGYPFALPTSVTATAASYTRTMPNTFGSICLPFAVSSDASVQYYTTNGVVDGALQLVEAENVAAGTPAIVFAEGKSLSIEGSGTLAVAGEADGDVKLTGSYTEQVINVTEDASKNYYGIANNEFTKATNTLTVKPFRAYLTTPASSPAKLRLGLADDEASAISVLTAEDATVKAIYNAAGAKQQRLQKGLNIVKMSNGTTTKVFVK